MLFRLACLQSKPYTYNVDDSQVFSHGSATCRPVVKSIVRSAINEEHLVALNKTLYIVKQETLPRD